MKHHIEPLLIKFLNKSASPKELDSDFITKYQVTGIPRFILIDPEGIIVHPDMLRPSQEKEIVAYFKDLGI